MSVTEEMRARLEAEFKPTKLEIVDDSESHRGHSGYQEGGESHLQVTIQSPSFEPMTRIARHRAVHKALGSDLVGRIHALELNISP